MGKEGREETISISWASGETAPSPHWEPCGAEQSNLDHPPWDPLKSRGLSWTSPWPLDLVITNSHTDTEISSVCIFTFELHLHVHSILNSSLLHWDFQLIKMTISSPSQSVILSLSSLLNQESKVPPILISLQTLLTLFTYSSFSIRPSTNLGKTC